MLDCFIVFYDDKLLVALTNFDCVIIPEMDSILDWYAKEYAVERRRLTGGFSLSVSVKGMKYREFTS